MTTRAALLVRLVNPVARASGDGLSRLGLELASDEPERDEPGHEETWPDTPWLDTPWPGHRAAEATPHGADAARPAARSEDRDGRSDKAIGAPPPDVPHRAQPAVAAPSGVRVPARNGPVSGSADMVAPVPAAAVPVPPSPLPTSLASGILGASPLPGPMAGEAATAAPADTGMSIPIPRPARPVVAAAPGPSAAQDGTAVQAERAGPASHTGLGRPDTARVRPATIQPTPGATRTGPENRAAPAVLTPGLLRVQPAARPAAAGVSTHTAAPSPDLPDDPAAVAPPPAQPARTRTRWPDIPGVPGPDSGAAIGGAMDQAFGWAAEVTDRGLAGIAGPSAAGEAGVAPLAVQNTFNVTVALNRALLPAEEDTLRDAVVQILVDSAQRQGLGV